MAVLTWYSTICSCCLTSGADLALISRLMQKRKGNDLVLRYCELTRAVISMGDTQGLYRTALEALSTSFTLDTSSIQDPRLQLALRQQEFTELLRKGGPDSELAALSEPALPAPSTTQPAHPMSTQP